MMNQRNAAVRRVIAQRCLRTTVFALLGWSVTLGGAGADEPIDFAHQVLPILSQHCAKCHSNGTYKGGLSIDTRQALLASDVIDLQNPADSELWRRVTSEDPDERMPPEGEPLSDKQLAMLQSWLKQDVPWEAGFSFKAQSYVARLKPRRPTLPVDFDGNPVDYWVDSYRASRDLVQPHAISDAQFLRRVYMDLGGLLPTLDEQAQYFALAPEVRRETVIDSLLNDEQRYAEHWLTFWNDHLRNDYRGTGFIDGGRQQITSWLYDALRTNKRYDKFVKELVSPTDASAGFIKGIKWRGRVNASQVPPLQFAQNTAQVFLGINLKCASCHDSFIDDWKLTDAYGLAAITSDAAIEIHRCDKPTGVMATAKFVFPELGEIDADRPRAERLQQLADLMIHPENGRLSRTMVNRLWQQLMGRGIVHPVDVMSNPPWSEDLLDWLAVDFVEHGYDLKRTLRIIVQSKAYQSHAIRLLDPSSADEFVFRGPLVKRMTAEQFSDAMWQLSGTHPTEAAADFGEREGPVRASLVISDPLMRSLGRPNREQVVTVRPDQLTTLQALDLTNGEVVASTLQRGAEHLIHQPDFVADRFVERFFQHALTRSPTAEEQQIGMELIGTSPSAERLSDFIWAVMMLPEFQTIQ